MHLWPRYIQKRYQQGPIFYVDWWPLGPRWLFLSDPEIISTYVTADLPKSILESAFLDQFLGENNMVSVEGQHWKNLRTMFNPGFSATHLMTLVPYIVDASVVFSDVIREKAKSNEVFELEEYATRLTIDIIGKVVLDSDFDSQKALHPIVETFRERVLLMPANTSVLDLTRFQFLRRWKAWRNGVKLDKLIGDELDRKVAARTSTATTTSSTEKASFKDRKRSVIDLALDAYQKEFQQKTTTTSKSTPMDKHFRTAAIDSMKTFIFAGHDTTASTIAYVFYLLHFHPTVHARLVSELDTVFDSAATTSSIATQIKSDPYIINKLDYTLAVLKETLRLFPPASTLRRCGPNSTPVFFTDPTTGQQLPLSGFDIWPIVYLVGRNERFFPQPIHFIPERFIPSLTPFATGEAENESMLFTPAGKDAWRPFEKGPRSCIGEQLAMMEQRIILALCVSKFDFVSVDANGESVQAWRPVETSVELVEREERLKRGETVGVETVEGHVPYQILKGAAKPRGGMRGRVELR